MYPAGRYLIRVGEREHEVTADSISEDPVNNALHAWKDGATIATFRWWDSITLIHEGA